MISVFFPLKKLRRNRKYLLLSAILLVCAVAVYNEMVAAKAWNDPSMNAAADKNSWRRAMFDQWVRKDQANYMEDSAVWASSYTPQTWKPEYKGQANLHVFEDWCGVSTAGLRKNLHYPLYPQTRTTVQKLAVSPQWTNYGLRIFGYLHPYIDGDFVFALSSDDNSELWLSSDDSPLNLQLLAWVGKTGTEWTAPGEFDKYSTQTSRPVWLSAQRRYFFEVIHKQDNKGTDHVEVAWQLLGHGFEFMVIESRHISLYVNESTFLMSDVTHIPQTAASHQISPTKQHSAAVDMLRKEPRDTLYQVPLISSNFLQGVLPDCVYNPSYTIKDFPLLRYQGLQFVHMSYIYPNDYTRLTHMESENSCFYPESNFYFKMYGFSGYMRFDRPDMNGNENSDFEIQQKLVMHEEEEDFDDNEREKESRRDHTDNDLFPDYGDDFDDYSQKRRRKLFSVPVQEAKNMPNSSNTRLHMGKVQRRQRKYNVPHAQTEKPEMPLRTQAPKQQKKGLDNKVQQVKPARKRLPERQKRKSAAKKRQEKKSDAIPAGREQLKKQERPVVPTEQPVTKKRPIQRPRSLNQTRIQRRKASKKPTVAKQQRIVTSEVEHHPDVKKHVPTPKGDIIQPLVRLDQRDTFIPKHLREKEMEVNMPLNQDVNNDINGNKTDSRWSDTGGQEDTLEDKGDDLVGKRTYNREGDWDSLWQPQEDSEGTDNEDFTPAPVFDAEVNWSQTFQFSHLDIQGRRSDWIDLHCNVSGNLLLHSSDVLPVVEAFMEHLNKKHNGRFTLEHVVNVVKRVDRVLGNRYLLELLLKDGVSGQLLRLSQYVYVLIRLRGPRSRDHGFQNQQLDTVLSNPVGFRWNPDATVHFIVPVKNQARWVQKLIDDMERLFRETGDANFNLIITDYDSTDMDVRKALQKSSLPRYQYVKLTGSFERSAGLQAGVDLINDDHSIVFLCDLHIHFPSSIIDTIRKHCVEGYMAFAPIVMRLDCGATPLDPRGYWEVNGFGLLGIYKSDLNAVGGMNTKEFKNRWGGEDWELLDRILQAGLEVERIYLRNFFHHFHSKRGMWNRRPSPGHR